MRFFWMLSVLLISSQTLGQIQSVCDFSARQLFENPGSNRSLAVGDFDGDSDADVAVATDENVAIFLNPGNGDLRLMAELNVGASPNFVLAEDFNNDGNVDLATISFSNATVSISLNDGSAKFQPAVEYVVSGTLGSAASGDFDADGDLDLAVISGNQTVAVLLNDGLAVFGSPKNVDFAEAGSIVGLATADFDGDANSDLAVVDTQNDQSIVASSDGLGGFIIQAPKSTGPSPSSICTADFDGDGQIDIVTSNGATSNQNLSVFINQGVTFAEGVLYDLVGSSTGVMAVGDIDGDSDIDIVTGDRNTDAISIVSNNGSGIFQFTDSLNLPNEPLALAVVDVNGDQQLDLFTLDSGRISLYRNRDGNGYVEDQSVFADFSFVNGESADLDQDGLDDLVITNSVVANTGTLTWFRNLGNGQFSSVVEIGDGRYVAMSDMDNDGDIDIVTHVLSSIRVLLNDGGASYSLHSQVPAGGVNSLSLVAGDVDNDGDEDVILGSRDSFTVYFNSDGNGTLVSSGEENVFDGITSSLAEIELADFNNDQILDVVTNSPSGIQLFLNDGDGSFTKPVQIHTSLDGMINAGDMDGDGNIDIVAGTGEILFNLGGGIFAPPTDQIIPTCDFFQCHASVLVDLDRDQDLDLVAAQIIGSRVCINDSGNLEFAGEWGSTGGQAVTVGNLDGDFRNDVLTFSSNRTAVLLNDCYILGDVNQDADVTLLDVNPFVLLLQNGEYQVEADMNLDGAVDLLDISLFVAAITGG